MNSSHRPHPHRARRSPGFSLMEVLVAIGLFAVGFAAVASIFPAGALLQRQTADDVQSRHTAHNAEALVSGTPVTYDDHLTFYHAYDSAKTPDFYHDNTTAHDHWRGFTEFPPEVLDVLWSRETTSYPTTSNQYVEGEPEDTAYDREFYWAPLVRDTSSGIDPPSAGMTEWELMVFVLRRQANRTYNIGDPANQYPEVDEPNLPSLLRLELNGFSDYEYDVDTTQLGGDLNQVLRPNDWIADDAGGIYRIESVGTDTITVRSRIRMSPYHDNTGTVTGNFPTTIWFSPAPRAGERSPTQQVILINDLPDTWGK